MAARAFAERPDDRTFLVKTGKDAEGREVGHVVDLRRGRVFPLWLIEAILMRGYWQDVQDEAGAREAERMVGS